LSELADEINKRLTLNVLIQGSAQHAFLTSHYLVRDELDALDPKLLPLYDRLALAGFVQYWNPATWIQFGCPPLFWRSTHFWPHPFRKHALLARHGLALSSAARDRAVQRCREKRVIRIPLLFDGQVAYLIGRLNVLEAPHLAALAALAKRTTSSIWAIPEDRLDACITRRVAFGRRRPIRSLRGALLRFGAAGYGGVLREGDAFRVVARGWNWPILSHELVKGTVELICLNGLSHLDEVTYQRVLRAADRPEYEPWMLQTGCELWRRLLPLLPDGEPVARVIMHLSRLAPRELEELVLGVIERPDWARQQLASLSTTS
jgi:hypothetical protein